MTGEPNHTPGDPVTSSNNPGPFAKLQADMECDARSQIKQDLFVLNQLHEKKNEYFVEFGASDDKTLSNT